ncbi:sugar transferase [Psychrobacillus sp. FSL K6-2836]|uniref:sugar transferase n=1 Tax=Psychrobacillus sp. FSL K6-2836 TaxID=2921548 RepID=UPI0030F59CFF
MKIHYQQVKEVELRNSERSFNKAIKRVFDILFSIAVIIMVSPILIIVAMLVKLEDGGPILFKQLRAGKNGTPFYIFKFRSMKMLKHQKKNIENPYNWPNRVPDDFVFKTTNGENSNVTKIGMFIRKFSLDELPQFFNVLKGEMSIVGPRPEIIEITNCYDDHQSQRLLVKPGITGWAQVNGRSDMNHGRKVELDLYYVQNIGFSQDIKIVLMTMTQTVFGKGSI